MKFLPLAIILVSQVGFTFGQDFDHYTTLLPEGPVPKDFTELSSSKVETEVKTITGEKRQEKRSKKDFVLNSTYNIDNFLASGNVLFSDVVSNYLKSVLNEILIPYPELKRKIRIYAVKSPAVNAFTSNDGIIFVNLGLLSRIENEAQLAFILSHEVVHFQKNHVINSYVTSVEIDRSKGDYRKLSVSERGFAKSTFSKELELEADLMGVDIFKQSKYSNQAIDQVFDVLKMADFPIPNKNFVIQEYESGGYVFPDTYHLKKLETQEINEDYDDSQSSHPNIKKRREAIEGKGLKGDKGNDFVVSFEVFSNVKKTAQFELCRLYLLEHNFVEALALATTLQEENPTSTFLRETKVKSLYGLAKLSLHSSIKLKNEDWVGESGRIARFVDVQSPYELCVLAIRELYKCYEESPENIEVRLMINDLIHDFGEQNEGVVNNFLRSSSDNSKGDHLTHPYTQYAFLEFKDQETFFKLFEKQSIKKEPVKEKKSKRKKAESKPIGVNKLVVVNPMYQKVDSRKRLKIRHADTEKVIFNINEKIEAAAKELKMETAIINSKRISTEESKLLRHNSILNDWIDEQFRNEKLFMVSPIYNEVVAIANEYQTDHFAWMGGISMQHKTYGKPWVVLGTVIMPTILPFSVNYLLQPKGNTLYFALVFDVRKQELTFADLRTMELNDSPVLMQSNIYYTLFNLK